MANIRNARGQATAAGYAPSWFQGFIKDTSGASGNDRLAEKRYWSNMVEELKMNCEAKDAINTHLNGEAEKLLQEQARLQQVSTANQARAEELASYLSKEKGEKAALQQKLDAAPTQKDLDLAKSEAKELRSKVDSLQALLARKEDERLLLRTEANEQAHRTQQALEKAAGEAEDLRRQVQNLQALLSRNEDERALLRTEADEQALRTAAQLQESITRENEAQKEVERVQQENKQLALEIAKAEQRCANAEGKAAEITAQLSESEGYIQQLEREAEELEKKVDDVELSLSYKAAELEQATARETAAKALSTEKVALQSQLAELTTQLTALTAENTALQSQKEESDSKLAALEADSVTLHAQTRDLESQNAELNQEKAALQREAEGASTKLAALAEENATLRTEVEEANSRLSELDRQREALQQDLAKAESRIVDSARATAILEGPEQKLDSTLQDQIEASSSMAAALEREVDQLRKQLVEQGVQATAKASNADENRTMEISALQDQVDQARAESASLKQERDALQSSIQRLRLDLQQASAAAESWQRKEAERARQLEDAELEIAGLKAQLHALEVSAGAASAHSNGNGSLLNSANGNEVEMLRQELEEAKALCSTLDEEVEKYAQGYAKATMAAQAAQAETAEAQDWMKQADEELQAQERTIRDLEETIRRISQTAPTTSDPDRRVPQAEPQAITGVKATVPAENGLDLSADMIDGGTEAEFSSDPKWSKLREEGAAAGWLLHPDEIERGRELGRGTYGTAYEARWRGVHAVVKCVRVRHADREEEAKQVTSFLREVETLSHLRHPHIMPFFGACMRSYEECWLVTEFLPGGDLSRWLHGDGGWAPKRSVEERLKMAVDVAKGMRAMHESQPPIVHRDLKPSNVFIDAKGNARVADMGLARHLRPGEEAYLTGTTGTYQYMAPEVIDGNAYDQTADVYSFGIMLWEIAVQQKPYEDAYLEAVQVARAVVEDDSFRPSLKKLPKHVPSAIGTLCQRCWSSFTEMRPPFAELVETLEAIEREQGARSSVHHGRSTIAKLWHGGEPVTQAT